MVLSKEQKRKAKRDLLKMSDDTERSEMLMHEMEEAQESLEKLSEAIENGAGTKEIKSLSSELSMSLNKLQTAHVRGAKEMVSTMKDMQEEFLKGIKDMHDTLKKQSFGSEINANAGPLYKTMINELSGLHASFKGWKYPQYAAVSVRNKNFANVNPAISPFGIEDYDEVDITYNGSNPTVVVYKLNGNTMGTLTLTYSGSNVTKVVRT